MDANKFTLRLRYLSAVKNLINLKRNSKKLSHICALQENWNKKYFVYTKKKKQFPENFLSTVCEKTI